MEAITIPAPSRPFVVTLFVREHASKERHVTPEDTVHLFTMVVMGHESGDAIANASQQLAASMPTVDMTVEVSHAIAFVHLMAAVESLVTREAKIAEVQDVVSE